jgi:hypothetical protein
VGRVEEQITEGICQLQIAQLRHHGTLFGITDWASAHQTLFTASVPVSVYSIVVVNAFKGTRNGSGLSW